jgi:hypothetical protein
MKDRRKYVSYWLRETAQAAAPAMEDIQYFERKNYSDFL